MNIYVKSNFLRIYVHPPLINHFQKRWHRHDMCHKNRNMCFYMELETCLKHPMYELGRAKRIWYLSPMRAAKVQASLRIRAVSPEPSLLAHISSESRGTFRQKARSLAPLNGWACAVKTCHDGMLEDTNSLDSAQLIIFICRTCIWNVYSIKIGSKKVNNVAHTSIEFV